MLHPPTAAPRPLQKGWGHGPSPLPRGSQPRPARSGTIGTVRAPARPRSRPGSATNNTKPKELKHDLIDALKTAGLQQYARKLEEVGLVNVGQLAKMRRPKMDELVDQRLRNRAFSGRKRFGS